MLITSMIFDKPAFSPQFFNIPLLIFLEFDCVVWFEQSYGIKWNTVNYMRTVVNKILMQN